MPAGKNDGDHWLVRPRTIRALWAAFIAVLVATVIADLFIDHHAAFGIEATIGFYAWYGFLSCVALIVLSLGLGVILKRPDSYYDR